MTQLTDPADRQDLSNKQFVLATDLDGTFLGGSAGARADLYEWIGNNRDTVGLIFVTGRDPGFISDLTRNGDVPRPDYVVGDVGTTIAAVGADHVLTPIRTLEAEIAAAWNDAGPRVHDALADIDGLRRQPTGFRYRVSYDMDPDRFDRAALRIVAGLGLDALVSDNRYFDVLPKGISKGPSLSRLLVHLGVAPERCLVAGDTLNDLSMLSLGVPAVAVGNSEQGLIAALAGQDHVHFATGEGAAGIAEAILALDLLHRNAA
ncbi:HAD-IIB family hydrolase [Actibacterium ureilyticum]|uniref:HAD-IIB family hydrolase n=1 Tax=Actibacterium ureilyticum TaxID=1590614 RepID=UPI000BAB2391|nr:HAD-IIB family hydrolase [Actibacterium ureilyticum]